MTITAAPPRFRGEFLTPKDERYQRFRGVVDRRFDDRPAVIARCAGVADVQAAVHFARHHDLQIAIRSGGHGFHGLSTVDGGIVIDLSLMRDVQVRPDRRVVRIRPGALGGDVVAETMQFGLAAASGTRARVGFGGQVIFNGQGYLAPRHGNACDNVLALELVLADGTWLRVTADEHPELFWALRGAGDSFGVVTAVEAVAHPVRAIVHKGMFLWEQEQVAEALVALGELDDSLSEDIWWSAVFEADADRSLRMGVSYTHVGSEATLERDLQLLASIAPALDREQEAISYVDLHYGPGFTGARTYLTGCQLRCLDRPTAELLVDLALELAEEPSGSGFHLRSLHLYPHSKGLGRPAEPPNACGLREGLVLNPRVSYDDAAQQAGHVAWADRATSALVDRGLTLRGFNGTSLNYVSRLSETAVAAYYGNDLPRLKEIKHRYDPDNVFLRNVAITARSADSNSSRP
jgi:FAD/FMN-containing dehydrogenase